MIVNYFIEFAIPPILQIPLQNLRMALKRGAVRNQMRAYKKLHLGCGNNILDGWANIDLFGNRQVISWDLTYQLPVRSGTIEFIFSEHFIEHLTLKQARALVSDCYRMLQPNGVLRVSTPSLEIVIDEYLHGLHPEWYQAGWHPATPCQMVNEGFHRWGHKFIYDVNELRQVLEQAGFRKITRVSRHESTHPVLANLECRPDQGEIIFEAIK